MARKRQISGGSRPNKKSVNGGGSVKKTIVKRPRVNVARVNGARVNVARKNVTVGDARLKIIAKNRSKVVDARDKLASLAKKTDARQKLQKIRNFKEGKVKDNLLC